MSSLEEKEGKDKMTNDRHVQEHPSKGPCLSRVSPVVALVWTDYSQEEEEMQ